MRRPERPAPPVTEPPSSAFRAFLLDGLPALGLHLDPGQSDLLDRFRGLIVAENRVQNLTTLESDFDFATKHVLDSLTCLSTGLFDGLAGRVVDVGTGAGFPGVPLRIARPGLEVTFLDSLRRRTAFLERMVASLGLSGCPVVCERAEIWGRRTGRRESYDVAVVRAVASLAVDLEYGLPLVRPGGRLVAMKGPRVGEEMAAALRAAGELGGVLDRTVEVSLPLTGEKRRLVVFVKVGSTPPEYPRREGVPSRRPLGRGPR